MKRKDAPYPNYVYSPYDNGFITRFKKKLRHYISYIFNDEYRREYRQFEKEVLIEECNLGYGNNTIGYVGNGGIITANRNKDE